MSVHDNLATAPRQIKSAVKQTRSQVSSLWNPIELLSDIMWRGFSPSPLFECNVTGLADSDCRSSCQVRTHGYRGRNAFSTHNIEAPGMSWRDCVEVIGSSTKHKYQIRLDKMLGSGKFGSVYLSRSKNSETLCAAKVGNHPNDTRLILETNILKGLGGNGTPLIHDSGLMEDDKPVVFMDLLGPSIQDVVEQRRKERGLSKNSPVFSEAEVSAIGQRVLRNLELVHSYGVCHGDQKPANLVFGYSSAFKYMSCLSREAEALKIVDFGLAKKWSKAGGHIPFSQDLCRFSGSLRYSSLGVQLGQKVSRRDDLQSLAYVLLWLLYGSLPWQGISGKGAEKSYHILLRKGSLSPEELCNRAPDGLLQFLTYALRLEFSQKPDYDYLYDCLNFSLSERENEFDSSNMKRRSLHLSPDKSLPSSGPRGRVSVSSLEKRFQWILVTSKSMPQSEGQESPTQTFIHAASKPDLESRLRCEGGTHASFVTHIASQGWLCVLRSDAPSSTRVDFIPQTTDLVKWLKRQISQDRNIQSICADESWFCIVTTEGKGLQQVVKTSVAVPKEWIASLWASTHHIAALLRTKKGWITVMRQQKQHSRQQLHLSFNYPSECIRTEWKNGFMIRNVVSHVSETVDGNGRLTKGKSGEAGSELSAWVIEDGNFTSQHCVRTSHLEQRIAEEQKKGYFVECISFGRTV